MPAATAGAATEDVHVNILSDMQEHATAGSSLATKDGRRKKKKARRKVSIWNKLLCADGTTCSPSFFSPCLPFHRWTLSTLSPPSHWREREMLNISLEPPITSTRKCKWSSVFHLHCWSIMWIISTNQHKYNKVKEALPVRHRATCRNDILNGASSGSLWGLQRLTL